MMETGWAHVGFLERVTPDSSFTLCLICGENYPRSKALSVFDLYRLRRNAYDNVMWFDVTGDHCAGTDHRVISNPRPREHGRVVRNPHAVPYSRRRSVDLVNVVNVVVVRVDVCVIRDRDVVPNIDAAAIVEEHITMNDHVISERQ